MKYSLFNKIKTNLTFDKGSVRMQIDYVKDDLLKTIAERFGIDYEYSFEYTWAIDIIDIVTKNTLKSIFLFKSKHRSFALN